MMSRLSSPEPGDDLNGLIEWLEANYVWDGLEGDTPTPPTQQ
jgi:hypothetical protein